MVNIGGKEYGGGGAMMRKTKKKRGLREIVCLFV